MVTAYVRERDDLVFLDSAEAELDLTETSLRVRIAWRWSGPSISWSAGHSLHPEPLTRASCLAGAAAALHGVRRTSDDRRPDWKHEAQTRAHLLGK